MPRFGGHGTVPQEQKTQQSPASGRSRTPQPAHSWKKRHQSSGISSRERWPRAGQVRREWRSNTEGVGPAQYCTPSVSAPSTLMLVPVIKLARGLARKTVALATSSAVAMRPNLF